MGFLTLTKDTSTILLNENSILRVYNVNSVARVEYIQDDLNVIKTLEVEETLSAIQTASTALIPLNNLADSQLFLLNSGMISSIEVEGSGSMVRYDWFGIASVEESATVVANLVDIANNGGVKVYEALLSQNAPIATTTDPTMVAGQIWTLEAYNAADAATIAALELISGTLYAVGSKYRSATDQTLAVNVATTLSYDGSPYVVSTDVNGDFNPFVNTLGDVPVLSRVDKGYVYITKTGAFSQNKTSLSIQKQGLLATNVASKSEEAIRWEDANTIAILTTDGTGDVIAGTTDGILDYHLVEIKVRP